MNHLDLINIQDWECDTCKNVLLENLIINNRLDKIMDKNINLITEDALLDIMINDLVKLTPPVSHSNFKSAPEIYIETDKGLFFDLTNNLQACLVKEA